MENKVKPKIKVRAQTKADKKNAKLLEEYFNFTYAEYIDLIDATFAARRFVEDCWGVKTPDSIWNRIIKSAINKNLKDIKPEKWKI